VDNWKTKQAFKYLFDKHYSALCSYAYKYINNTDECEEIVQDVFMKLWSNKDKINIDSSIKSYLYKMVRNSCLNLIKHVKLEEKYRKFNKEIIEEDSMMENDSVIENELSSKIRTAIDKLPEQRKRIFLLSRYEGLKNKEIAEKLNLSIKTVENHIGLALKDMRLELKDYLPTILIILQIALGVY
jgi:RNA polymerase sigma-70 factor (ECF subfamily)